jgi:ABC-type glycerol-3-phosphate transport system substrate-binding protein
VRPLDAAYGYLASVRVEIGNRAQQAPLGASGADLVVWWEAGYYAEEDEAVREIIAAFEQRSGKEVELAFYPQADIGVPVHSVAEALWRGAGRP